MLSRGLTPKGVHSPAGKVAPRAEMLLEPAEAMGGTEVEAMLAISVIDLIDALRKLPQGPDPGRIFKKIALNPFAILKAAEDDCGGAILEMRIKETIHKLRDDIRNLQGGCRGTVEHDLKARVVILVVREADSEAFGPQPVAAKLDKSGLEIP